MSKPKPVEYADASSEVRAVFDEIKDRRKVADVNNFWKYLAADPGLLRRTWDTQKAVLSPGALDLVTKEMIYLAVSITNGCSYGIACHTHLAQKPG
jgi:AhpD family alkylhydroperoxidase